MRYFFTVLALVSCLGFFAVGCPKPAEQPEEKPAAEGAADAPAPEAEGEKEKAPESE